MKKRTHNSSCEQAAERIKVLFSKGSLYHLYLLFLSQNHGFQSFSQSHKCDFIKIPRLPAQLERLSLQAAFTKKKSSKAPAFHQPLTTNQLTVSIDPPESNKNELSPHRIKRWKLKEYLLASRRLKNLKKHDLATYPVRQHEITLMGEKTKSDNDSSEQQAQWQDFIKAKEERHFQIGRIIKYLSD